MALTPLEFVSRVEPGSCCLPFPLIVPLVTMSAGGWRGVQGVKILPLLPVSQKCGALWDETCGA